VPDASARRPTCRLVRRRLPSCLPARPVALGELKSKYPPCCSRLPLPCAGQQAVLEAVSRFVSAQPEGIAVDFDSDRAAHVPSDSVELPDGRRRTV
jgi:hypothetical protein